MNIVLIGAGNLATNLGKALKQAGHTIQQVYSRTMASARQLAVLLDCPATNDLQQLAEAEVYIFSIKDAALQDVVSVVCPQHPDAVFLHTAGSMPMTIFQDHGQHYGVIYTMQTFSKAREVDFRVIPTFIEWNDETAHHAILSLAESVSHRVYPLSSADRKYLHLSAVWACNFANHCYDVAASLLQAHHLPFDVMLPLIDETARKVHALSPREAQTGPAVRYDENVIQAQAELLKDDPTRQELYILLSKSIHEKANS